MVIIAIIIFWYEISRLKNKHRAEIADYEKAEMELKKRMREREDELFFIHQGEKREIVLNELKFFFKCDYDTARGFYKALEETYMITDFFAAETDNERIAIVDEARMQYNEKCKDN